MRMLIAEDDRLTADTLARRLREEHYAVDVCYDGTDAWHYLTGAEYDVAVLDIMMPGMDGITLLKRLRAAGGHVPVLLLTVRDAGDDRVAGLNAGADDYLVKPFAYEELSARLRVLTRAQITEHVWSYDYEGASNMIDVYIRSLRRKIDDGHAVRFIHTVRYTGYVLREGT